jgi:hypothetical protein
LCSTGGTRRITKERMKEKERRRREQERRSRDRIRKDSASFP